MAYTNYTGAPKRSGAVKTRKNGAEVCSVAGWKKRRWELFGKTDKTCFMCGSRLKFGADHDMTGTTNFHAHHSLGTRGLGGGKRDDRIFVPGEWTKELRERYPFAPEPPEGMKWNLYGECNRCHQEDEHNQGCAGELQWSKSNGGRESTEAGSSRQDSLFGDDV